MLRFKYDLIFWDKQDIAIRNKLRAAGVRVKDPDDGKNNIWLVMPANVLFASRSTELNPMLKQRFKANPTPLLIFESHELRCHQF